MMVLGGRGLMQEISANESPVLNDLYQTKQTAQNRPVNP